MTINQILTNLDLAVEQLIANDFNLIQRGLNEPLLSGQLKGYLEPLFPEYDVNAEYNGDIDKPNDRKALDIAKNRLREIGFNPHESDNYRLTPDIIIHRQNSNKSNLVVIEVKKGTNNNRNMEFDLLKLEHLTIDYLGNHYNYKVGVALVLGTAEKTGQYKITYFQDGVAKTRLELRDIEY